MSSLAIVLAIISSIAHADAVYGHSELNRKFSGWMSGLALVFAIIGAGLHP